MVRSRSPPRSRLHRSHGRTLYRHPCLGSEQNFRAEIRNDFLPLLESRGITLTSGAPALHPAQGNQPFPRKQTGSTVTVLDSDVAAACNSGFDIMSPDTSGTLNLSGVTQLQNVSGAATFTIHSNPSTGSEKDVTRTREDDGITLKATVVPELRLFSWDAMAHLREIAGNARNFSPSVKSTDPWSRAFP